MIDMNLLPFNIGKAVLQKTNIQERTVNIPFDIWMQ